MSSGVQPSRCRGFEVKKTSLTDPLKIAEVSAGTGLGLVGITLCPGKYDPHGMNGIWARDLSLDLDVIRDWKAAAVVTLVEQHELTLLRVENLEEEVVRREMRWFHLPIVDQSIPDADFERRWRVAGDELCRLLRDRCNVLVHCRGGLGRAGTIAARLLIELGMEPAKAVEAVRAARSKNAIETPEQERFVLSLTASGPEAGLAAGRQSDMDWFEKLTGFRESGYEETRARLEVEGERLRSRVNGADYGIGVLELVSLQALRDRARAAGDLTGQLKARVVQGDVRRMHRLPENAGALFQVASQFNLLEMVSEKVTPEEGVTRYQYDATQGPACAIAAGAATIYRNYFAPVEGRQGQTANRQLNGLADDLGAALSTALGVPVDSLWSMQNGYALGTQSGLDAIARHLETLATDQLDALRGKLRIGIHRDVEVTEAQGQSARGSLNHTARRSRSSAAAYRPPIGSRSRRWSWRPPTKPPCGLPYRTRNAVHRMWFS